ncbi:MAG: hypothetical protein GY859_19805 [Desulfobacterales bacterium]|nr:hypothetical protein [Desulfobacterales bacterium]
MLYELQVNLDSGEIAASPHEDGGPFGKALAVERILACDRPEETIYLTGYTPLAAAGLGFSGKLNLYGISLLGGNLQGSRSGGLFSVYLTRLGITGIKIEGQSERHQILVVDGQGKARLVPLATYGTDISGTFDLARAVYGRHGEDVAMAITDPRSTGFRYNAVACNSGKNRRPDRVAGRGTTIFGRNGLVGVVAERAPQLLHSLQCDRRATTELLRKIHKAKTNITLVGSADPQRPLLGGTYGSAAAFRFDFGHGLTNLFRNADVPAKYLESLLPETIVRRQIDLSRRSGIPIVRRSCLPGCPNKCGQMVVLENDHGGYEKAKAGEWETYQGLINLGLFEDTVKTTSFVLEHSNNHAYDHIEALVTLAALALATETKSDTGVRYGDGKSVVRALEEAVQGGSELGRLVREGAAAVENHYGMERHFTVGGHALPFHNGRSMLQTGIGLSWTYGRHGESCAGPGRHNFIGQPYDPADRSLDAETHVLNAIHGMILYGAMDELGLCFFMGPSVDTLLDNARLLNAVGIETDPKEMIAASARRLRKIHDFNRNRGVAIQPLPKVFYETATYGNATTDQEPTVFSVPFDVVRDYGAQVLDDAAERRTAPPF